MGRRMILVVAILAAMVFGVSGASAATTFTDLSGDAVAGAADFTQLVVSNDLDGNITFAFTFANRTASGSARPMPQRSGARWAMCSAAASTIATASSVERL